MFDALDISNGATGLATEQVSYFNILTHPNYAAKQSEYSV